MQVIRRSLLGLVAGLALLTACSGPVARPVEPSGPLPADRVVFAVTQLPGFTPPIYWALTAPATVFYGDGRVIVTTPQQERGARPYQYAVARIDAMAVARLVARIDASGLVDDKVDYGEPQVTDLGSTQVLTHGERGNHIVSVYAFGSGFDKDISRTARNHREQLRALITEAEDLARSVTSGTYVPERVVVFEMERFGSTGDGKEWPGPDPAIFMKASPNNQRGAVACGELTGEAAAAVYEAALHNPDQVWRVKGTTRVLAVNGLPLGISC